MGVNKLDIEFEDDDEIQAREEAERRKSEVPEDVDLEFGAESGTASSGEAAAAVRAAREKAAPAKQERVSRPAQATPQASPQAAASQPVQQQPVQQHAQGVQMQQLPQAQVFVGPDYKLGDELKKVAASNQVLAIEIEARVKVEVTQQLTEIIAETHAKNKLIEHKINKILTNINQKVPALKNELMMIKKLLKEHATLGEEEEEESRPQQSQPAQAKRQAVDPRRVKKKAA